MYTELIILIVTIFSIIFVKGESQVTAPSQTICYEIVNSPDKNPLWRQSGLDMNVDWVIKCGNIVAYKLQWPTTSEWSDWYVTGINDLAPTNNTNPTRMWSLFSDYYHIFIICKSNKYKLKRDNC